MVSNKKYNITNSNGPEIIFRMKLTFAASEQIPWCHPGRSTMLWLEWVAGLIDIEVDRLMVAEHIDVACNAHGTFGWNW